MTILANIQYISIFTVQKLFQPGMPEFRDRLCGNVVLDSFMPVTTQSRSGIHTPHRPVGEAVCNFLTHPIPIAANRAQIRPQPSAR